MQAMKLKLLLGNQYRELFNYFSFYMPYAFKDVECTKNNFTFIKDKNWSIFNQYLSIGFKRTCCTIFISLCVL